KLYKLNHIARECTKKRKECKYCGLATHEVAKCRNENNTSKHKCMLCSGQYPNKLKLHLIVNISFQSIDPIVLGNTETLDKVVEFWAKCVVDAGEAIIGIRAIWKGNKPWWSDSLCRLRKRAQKSKDRFCKQRTPRNLMLYKKISKQLQRKVLFEKHQHMIKSIDSLHEGNTGNLFTQFKALKNNKICIIPALVDKEMNSVARSDADKAYLLTKTFQSYLNIQKMLDSKW
ncbi:hypothetical protein RFI_09633, partial [Reticulomyxa filosa]